MKTIYISGNRELDKLPDEAIARINKIIQMQAKIILTDSPGVEALVQHYLKSCDYKNVAVYFLGKSPRNNAGFQCFQTPKKELYIDRRHRDRKKGYGYIAQERYLCDMADYGMVVVPADYPNPLFYMKFMDASKIRIIRFNNK